MPVLQQCVGFNEPDFKAINEKALPYLPSLVRAWLPNGKQRGREWVCRNPQRNDRRPGSFCVNLHSGRWADFAIDVKGGDVVSLAAYLFNTSQAEAARTLAAAFEWVL
jgi:hypothetical protein